MSNRTDIKIFVASSGELNTERDDSVKLFAEINKLYPHLHIEPVLFELDTDSGNVPGKERIQDGINPLLEESDIVVVLFYSKAGEFTIEEFKKALSLKKKVYLYLKEGFNPKGVAESKKYLELQELIEEVKTTSSLRPRYYKTLIEYYGLLSGDLRKYIDKIYPAPANTPSVTVSTSYQHIPVAPRPYLAHPYSIIKNFTGRQEEMTRLSEWYKFEKEPLCIIEAIGGMGKSALCWKWLQDEIIATNTSVKGIIWWSFYDQSFDDFIHHAYEYCIPENIRNQKQRIDETTELISAFTNHQFLLVLDGFERVLRGYAQMMAMYIQEQGLSQKQIDNINEAFDIHQRTPITLQAEKLLRTLCSAKTKILMTTRLYPATIEGLAGIKHIKLTGLSKTDTIAFFKVEDITGTDDEMIRAGEIYGFHPLMLKLLASAIKRSINRDIKKALSGAFSQGLIDQKEPQKILATSYKLLNAEEQKVVAACSVFRTAFVFDAAKALFPDIDSEKLEEIIMELCNLGFIMYNEQQKLFDFHPILRSYLYDGITGKDEIHELAISYFTALPPKEKIITLADLEPVIEQYYHLVRTGRIDDAFSLYRGRFFIPLFYQLALYELCIDLCRLFILPTDSLPRLSNKSDQTFTLTILGLCYANTGQWEEAGKSLRNAFIIDYETNHNINLGIGLSNISASVPSGKFSQGLVCLSKSLFLLKGKDSFHEAESNVYLANILTAHGCYFSTNEIPAADKYLDKAMKYGIRSKQVYLCNLASLGYTKLSLARIYKKGDEYHLQIKALNRALKSMEFADQFRMLAYPQLLTFLNSYEALGRSLIALMKINIPLNNITGQVFFYDEHFQEITHTVIPNNSNYATLAERCVHEGLVLSRRMNRVFAESDFLLLCAQLEWQKFRNNPEETLQFKQVEQWMNDTHALANRIGYRVLLTDLHLFCAEVLIDIKQLNLDLEKNLLNLTAKAHIIKAREYALDTSTIEDIFLPPDGSADEFYKDIPEYEMLKRGLTDQERIEKGYYAAWLRADELEKRCLNYDLYD